MLRKRFLTERSLDTFTADELLFDAVLFNLEVIGEAVKKLPEDAKSVAPEADWTGPARMRDLIAHHYFSVEPEIVWEAATRHVPRILGYARRLRERFEKRDGS